MVSPKLTTCEFASNPPLFSKICHLFLKSATFLHKSAGFSDTHRSWPQSRNWGVGGDGLDIGQGHTIQGTLCSRGASSKNFRSGTHRLGTHQPCITAAQPKLQHPWHSDYEKTLSQKSYVRLPLMFLF